MPAEKRLAPERRLRHHTGNPQTGMLPMTLKQIEAFYWAAKLGTFAIAAQRLHITQSSLSKRIAELEASVGEALFDRSSKRGALTDSGEAILVKAKQMLDLTQSIRNGTLNETVPAVCRFGISELSAATWFPGFINKLAERYPNLTPIPQIGLGKALERLVERGELDFAVIAGAASSTAIASRTVAEVEFCWMTAPTSPDRRAANTARRDLPLISSTADSNLSTAISSWAASARVDIQRVISCNSLTTIVGLTVAGMGTSCLPRHYVQALVKRRKLAPVRRRGSAPPTLSYSFIWRRDDERRLVTIMRDMVLAEANFAVSNPLWS